MIWVGVDVCCVLIMVNFFCDGWNILYMILG